MPKPEELNVDTTVTNEDSSEFESNNVIESDFKKAEVIHAVKAVLGNHSFNDEKAKDIRLSAFQRSEFSSFSTQRYQSMRILCLSCGT